MKPALKARFERLGPVRDIPRVASGSSARMVLEPTGALSATRTIDAVHALIAHGVAARLAKRAVERAVERRYAVVDVPQANRDLHQALQLAGFSVVERQEIAAIDVGALRERLGLTQREFALRYGLNERTLQGWEQGRPMDDTAKAYLTVIAALPDVTSSALELAVHSTAQGGSSGTPVKR